MLSQLPNSITSPAWWQLINWIGDPIGFQQRYSLKYGDIFSMHLSGMGSYVIIGNPQAIQEIFNQDSKFDVGRGNDLAKPLIGQNSLMLMDGGRQYSPVEYLPFGGGSRRCLGYALAQLEMKLVLATILSKYQLVLAEDKPVKLQRRGFTLAPKGGVQITMTGKRL